MLISQIIFISWPTLRVPKTGFAALLWFHFYIFKINVILLIDGHVLRIEKLIKLLSAEPDHDAAWLQN